MPEVLKIITNPSDTLRKISKDVDLKKFGSKKLETLCLSMAETMLEKDGIGLAAPQIGENIRLVVINTKEGVICMANPRIIKKSLRQESGEEGCLSVPNYFGQVKRYKSIKCVYYDKDGKEEKINAEGMMARVIQHEIDHLDGILFIDKAKDVKFIPPPEEK